MLRAPLPPLNALRAFEATARHLSLRTAAEELHVTSPAISHQIKLLENHLGFKLFERLSRGVRLTGKGETYYYRVSRALEAVSSATKDIRQAGTPRALRLAVPPHLLSGWLIARLPSFLQNNPLTDLRVVDTVRRVDLDSEGVDAQILWGTGTWSGLQLDRLVEDDLSMVCSPKFLQEFGPIRSLRDLGECPLIHTDRRPVSWERVLGSASVVRAARARNLVVLRPIPAVHAALRGLGVAIVSRICVADFLTSGALVIPIEHSFQGFPKLGYFFTCTSDRVVRTRFEYVRDWLKLELSRTVDAQVQ